MILKDSFRRISPEIWKELVSYNKDTGSFWWKEPKRKHYKSNGAYTAAYLAKTNKEAFLSKNNYGYFYANVFGRTYYAHTIAWVVCNGRYPKNQIDHINGVKTDNSIANLREVDNRENHINMKMNKRNKSGVTGVYFANKIKRWRVEIRHNNKSVHIGVYRDFIDAVNARKKAEKDYGYHENHGLKEEERRLYETL